MSNYFNNNTIIFLNGAFVKASEASIDLYSQSLHYGYSVFEGIRAYKTEAGKTKIFKEEQHFTRLRNSAKAINLPYHWTNKELIEATYSVLEQNNLQDAYIRPLVFAPANMSFSLNTESYITIQAWAMEPFLGDKLIRVGISSYQRPNPKGFNIEAKAGGHYVNSILASQEMKGKGFDEGLLLDMNGYIAEGPGANVFFEKNGKLTTPSLGNILPGITRATILEIGAQLGIEINERHISVNEAKNAEAAFFCGTAAEIIGWKSLDEKEFTLNWEDSQSRRIQLAFQDLIREKKSQTTTKQVSATAESIA